MDADAVARMFEDSEGLLRGHFLLSSGKHADTYLQSAKVLCCPCRAEALGRALAAALAKDRVEVVVSPALGGLIIGHEVARALGVSMLFAEKDGSGGFSLRRGFSLAPGARVAVVEDVLTTRGSAARACAAVSERGGEVVAVAAVADRGPGGVELPAPVRTLWQLEVKSYDAAACPICAEDGEAPVKPGSAG